MGASLGHALRYLRKQSVQTLEDVANEVGITPAALSLFETGKRNPSPKILGQLAAALNYSVEELSSLLESERSAGRLEDARSSATQAGQAVPPRMPERQSRQWLPPTQRRVFSPRPIEDLFDSPANTEHANRFSPHQMTDESDLSLFSSNASWLDEEEVPLKFLRATARHDTDTAARLEAIDALADNASLALRTLRGLAEDANPDVRREARRMLRELGVEVPGSAHEGGESPPESDDTER